LILSLIALLSTATIEFLIKDAVSARFDLGEVKVVIGSVALEMKTTLPIYKRLLPLTVMLNIEYFASPTPEGLLAAVAQLQISAQSASMVEI
jgi:hypothetical protein